MAQTTGSSRQALEGHRLYSGLFGGEMADDLDRFVAEKTVGIKENEDGTYYVIGEPTEHGNKLIYQDSWNPTKDMNQAMVCVEKLIDGNEWHFELHYR